MIDKQSPIPIYFQIEALIDKQIKDGVLRPGEALPSEREFASEYGVSRMTIRQGITNLVQQKKLYREKGKGTFVSWPNIEQPLSKMTSFTEDMKNREMEPGSKLLSFNRVEATGEIASILGISEGTMVFAIKRVRLADHMPIALEQTYITCELAPDLHEGVLHSSLYQYFEQECGYIINDAEQTIKAILATSEDAALLEVEKGSPLLAIRRQARLEDNRVLEAVYSHYRGDRYHFVTKMSR
ncbi:transcriptional regulator of N-Acetylglucosamine utilization, GntR family [Bacillus sp. JCM 19046]|uniref:GntR family transcriptional regulator n=1 Tax=Shouchella xiaoxiensis TaxID=766895 RepID=A0ABS2SSE9_9BACI|nr:GntR family transcriptional regulator [Shouchella xiaoxiensis]MBM7837926.1 GntR family transcriptional regulator [Shouchella xiaoxiensis]GAF12228.1 transcriptional regulator of N-Acetylglucosamine utilization, GntR family [Bacillus sp. JCM 19045]GAF18611.1 transcriptional regulator of N-Acetylglucosamine utilization, GntR family [Bacillus sp. JCM 19046]